jgi:acetyltransferase-like isoleucine patch superfamily enzyme
MNNRKYNIIRYDWPFHFISFVCSILPDNIIFIKLRGTLLSYFVKSAGKNLQIGRDVTIYNPSNISFGNNVYIAKGCFFSCGDCIEIGNNILFGPYVVIVTSDHSYSNGAYYWGAPKNIGKVIIKDGAWVSAHTTILSQSIIETGTLIAANAVFKGDSLPRGIYGGIPAKLIKIAID